MKNITIAIVSLLFCSCNGTLSKDEVNLSSESENTSKGIKNDDINFYKTAFTDRAEELIYIRKYIEYRLPKVLIEEEPKKMEEALEELIGRGKNVTLEEAVKYTWMYNGAYKHLWYLVTQNNLSFAAVKKMLSSYDALYPKEQQKIIKDTKILPIIEKDDDVERPPVADGRYNPNEEKIHGDFNGDGKSEYAYRVLTKQGKGNPVEGGTPDEYEVQFSDKNILPIKVGCCSFRLIGEEDLNNDGAYELTILQSSMNGCIREAKTYTVKYNIGKLLIKPFTFYICAELTSAELSNIIVIEKGRVYYHEADPNDEYLLNDEGDKIRFERLIKKAAIFR